MEYLAIIVILKAIQSRYVIVEAGLSLHPHHILLRQMAKKVVCCWNLSVGGVISPVPNYFPIAVSDRNIFNRFLNRQCAIYH